MYSHTVDIHDGVVVLSATAVPVWLLCHRHTHPIDTSATNFGRRPSRSTRASHESVPLDWFLQTVRGGGVLPFVLLCIIGIVGLVIFGVGLYLAVVARSNDGQVGAAIVTGLGAVAAAVSFANAVYVVAKLSELHIYGL